MAMELKQKKINEVKQKLDIMNENIDKVLKYKEENMRDRKAREDFER